MKNNPTGRRTRAAGRLEAQLKSGTKTAKKGTTKVELTDNNVKRIKAELVSLKKKI